MGECSECGEDIPKERMKFLSDRKIKTCVHCQELLEESGRFQRHKMNTTIRFKGDEIESMEETVARAANE